MPEKRTTVACGTSANKASACNCIRPEKLLGAVIEDSSTQLSSFCAYTLVLEAHNKRCKRLRFKQAKIFAKPCTYVCLYVSSLKRSGVKVITTKSKAISVSTRKLAISCTSTLCAYT